MPFPAHLPAIAGLLLTGALFLHGCGGSGGGGGGGQEPSGYTLSGAIQPAAGTAMDSTVNDPAAPFTANNHPTTAQPIPNPVTLGGYVNQPGAGPGGRSRLNGDPVDWYRVELLANQTVTLFIAEDGRQNDLDLFLTDLEGNLLDASAGQRKIESLRVRQDGEYLLVVQAYQGASNYILSIAQQGTATRASHDLQLSDPFVPGEIVAHLATTEAQGAGLNQRAQALSLAASAGAAGRNSLLKLENLQRLAAQTALGIDTASRLPPGLQISDPELRPKLETLYAIKALRRRADVHSADPNYIRRPNFVPNDPLYPLQWHYSLINLPQAWDLSSGSDTIVAVLDTGVVLSHPDLQGQLVAGYDFISDPANAGDGDGIDPDPNDPGDGIHPDGSSSFHGTHVAGMVAAATNNQTGVAGVAFSARIMPLRVLGRFGATDYDIEQAVRFAAGLANDSGTVPPRRADVINLSLGGSGFSASSQAVFDAAREAGMVIVAAAGNAASDTLIYPAAYSGVIGVSAVDINKELAPYSNFGSFVDVAAPGGNMAQDVDGDGHPDGVLSTGASDASGTLSYTYPFLQGTSMAAPHVAGVVALMRSANPALTPEDISNLLASGAITQDLGAPGRDDRFGHGLINAYQAVVAAREATDNPVTPTPILTISPDALNFGLDRTRMLIRVSNGGGGSLMVDSPDRKGGDGWLSLAADVDAHGLGSYTVTVARSGLSDGTYTATLSFASNANTAEVSVIMQVNNNLSPGEVGQQYVLLVDPASRDTISSVAAERQADGTYTYRFRNVAPGSYQIFAGSDINNDGLICDSGESCGAYLTLDQPVTVEVTRNIDGLDLVSGFSAALAEFGAAAADIGSPQGFSRHPGKQLRRR